jgi:hypothetical protein
MKIKINSNDFRVSMKMVNLKKRELNHAFAQ